MLNPSPAFLLASGVMLIAFAFRPATLESLHNALREFTVAVFGDFQGRSEKPLSQMERLILAAMGATLVFLSGATMA